ncbi:unnamed protein product [Nesidiocoris tenuis]|uniref:DM10 domain-containing protein n=1 Tax=Nesidiocoris tenuis TaxID=355587 RepID=A0A6H5GAF4_9HEMI|nr:unnamed protein product [Nesidiocoris tenuis]
MFQISGKAAPSSMLSCLNLPTRLSSTILKFDAFWLESAAFPEEGNRHFVHKCVVYFYLEDGTVKVVEPKIRNSGLPQGKYTSLSLVERRRQRIQYYRGDGSTNDNYDIIDFNIGKEVDIYGRKFTLVDCDKFTRQFLNRLGIPVPDPIVIPEDPYTKKREKIDGVPEKKRAGKAEAYDSAPKLDNRILGFKAYWDDRENPGGYLHLLNLIYFLSDGTIEVSDVTDPDKHYILVKRMRLPKEYKGLSMPGENDPMTLLNVIGDGKRPNRSIADPLDAGRSSKEFYRDKDITIGAVVNSFGRKFVVYDCDNFTKEYYKVKFGLDDFTPAPRPLTKEEVALTAAKEIGLQIAPYNGFGSYEDSLRNCLTVHPSQIVKSMKQFYEKDRFGYDSKILRFSAIMLSKDPVYHGRKYIISYFLADDTINIHDGETAPNTGVNGGMLISRRQILKPGQDIYSSKTPQYYDYRDLFIGNYLELEGHSFHIVGADEYALHYMETHPNEVYEAFREGRRYMTFGHIANWTAKNYLFWFTEISRVVSYVILISGWNPQNSSNRFHT